MVHASRGLPSIKQSSSLGGIMPVGLTYESGLVPDDRPVCLATPEKVESDFGRRGSQYRLSHQALEPLPLRPAILLGIGLQV